MCFYLRVYISVAKRNKCISVFILLFRRAFLSFICKCQIRVKRFQNFVHVNISSAIIDIIPASFEVDIYSDFGDIG